MGKGPETPQEYTGSVFIEGQESLDRNQLIELSAAFIRSNSEDLFRAHEPRAMSRRELLDATRPSVLNSLTNVDSLKANSGLNS